VSDPGKDDREAVDRAFADLVAGYHLTAEPPDPQPRQISEPEVPTPEPARSWADDHPLFHYDMPIPEPEPEPEERFVAPPPPPLPHPAWPTALAWGGLGYAALVVLAASFGLPLPTWAGWIALAGFVGGFAILVARLPRHRPPGAGDGAIL
jgi:hypothetical protein